MESIDYFDSYVIESETAKPVDHIAREIFALPSWVVALLKLRHVLIARPFGLRTGTLNRKTHGSDFRPMTVIDKNENEVLMGDDDKHLNFLFSVMKRNRKELSEITLTTVVKFHNTWGRVYFAFVKPFHKVIVKSILKKI